MRWVAIADDGSFVATVVNDTDHPTHKGLLIRLSPSAGQLTPDFKSALKNPPNTTSVDSSGTRIAVADGFPNFTPGAFYLFDNTGAKARYAHDNRHELADSDQR